MCRVFQLPIGILQANDIAPVPEPTPATRKRAASPDDVIDLSDDSDQEDNSSRIAKLEVILLVQDVEWPTINTLTRRSCSS